MTKQVECKNAETLKADIDGYTQGRRRETELQTKENQLEAPKLLKEEHTENCLSVSYTGKPKQLLLKTHTTFSCELVITTHNIAWTGEFK